MLSTEGAALWSPMSSVISDLGDGPGVSLGDPDDFLDCLGEPEPEPFAVVGAAALRLGVDMSPGGYYRVTSNAQVQTSAVPSRYRLTMTFIVNEGQYTFETASTTPL